MVWANSNTYQSENGEKYPSIHRAAGPAILNLGRNSGAFFLCNLAYLLAIGLSFLPLPPCQIDLRLLARPFAYVVFHIYCAILYTVQSGQCSPGQPYSYPHPDLYQPHPSIFHKSESVAPAAPSAHTHTCIFMSLIEVINQPKPKKYVDRAKTIYIKYHLSNRGTCNEIN